MTKAAYVGVSGKARKIKKGYIGVGGKARKIKKAYVGVGGAARPFWGGGELAYYGEITSTSGARAFAAPASIEGYALFAGGKDGEYMPKESGVVDVYDESLTKTTADSLTNAAYWVASAEIGGYAIFAGGTKTTNTPAVASKEGMSFFNTVDAYDTSLTKTTAASLGSLFSGGRGGMVAAPIGNYALFGGGTKSLLGSGSSATNTYAYDKSLTQTTATDMSFTHYLGAATTIGGYALFSGGGTANENGGPEGAVYVVDVYDASLTRTTATNMSQARTRHAAATVGDYAIFAGGYNAYTEDGYNTVDVYDASLTRTTAANMSFNGLNLTATTLGEYAIVGVGYGIVDAYDASLTRTSLNAPGLFSSSAATVGEYAVFAGGSTNSSIYDPNGSTKAFAYTIA